MSLSRKTKHIVGRGVDRQRQTNDQPEVDPGEIISASSPRILVLDDEESLVELIGAALRRAGYMVAEAVSPFEAIVICETFQKTIDLVVSDFNMPGLNGTQFAERVRPVLPDARFIFMTGDADAREDLVAKGFVCFLKPFTFADLIWSIQRSLTFADQWRRVG
jgi:CheY-like chemotaxis protein